MSQTIVYIVLAFFVVANFLIGLWVLVSNKRNITNKLFLFFIACILGWLITNALADASQNEFYAIFWTKLTMFTAGMIPWSLTIFSFAFPSNKDFSWKKTLFFAPVLLIISYLSIFTSSIIKDAHSVSNITQVEFGKLAFIYATYFVIFSIGALVHFYFKFRRSKGRDRVQLEYLLLGLFFSILSGTITNLVLPVLFNIFTLTPFGPLTTGFLVAFTAYAIVAHQLFDIRVIIKRTVVYSGLLLFTLVVYSMVIFFFTAVFGGGDAFNIKTFVSNLVAAILIAIGFDPIRRYLTAVTDKYLFKGEYDPQAILAELSKELSGSLDIREAMQSLVMLVKSQLRLSHTAVIVFSKEDGQTVVKEAIQDGYANPTVLALVPENLLLQHQAQSPQVLVTEVLKRDYDNQVSNDPTVQMYKMLLVDLEKLNVAVAIPILVDQKSIGMFLVGEKLSGDAYTKNEIEFLTIVANQTATAIEKARFWQEDQMKTEFVSIASHELLTPTAAIKGYLSMILDDNMGEIDEQARAFLVKVFNSADRLSHLVEDLLNVSRIESGRLKVNKREFSLLDSAKRAADELQVNAKNKNIDLAMVMPQVALPNVYADPDHIYRVLVNLISNAIKYTPQGWVRCFVTQYDPNIILFSVSDSGLGIPSDSLPHLFEKFYRADRREIAGIQGTGLGLYISKKIIELMGGQLWVASEVGKGTTFYFTLPIARPDNQIAVVAPQPAQSNAASH